jgi:hypothetical protein
VTAVHAVLTPRRTSGHAANGVGFEVSFSGAPTREDALNLRRRTTRKRSSVHAIATLRGTAPD